MKTKSITFSILLLVAAVVIMSGVVFAWFATNQTADLSNLSIITDGDNIESSKCDIFKNGEKMEDLSNIFNGVLQDDVFRFDVRLTRKINKEMTVFLALVGINGGDIINPDSEDGTYIYEGSSRKFSMRDVFYATADKNLPATLTDEQVKSIVRGDTYVLTGNEKTVTFSSESYVWKAEEGKELTLSLFLIFHNSFYETFSNNQLSLIPFSISAVSVRCI